MLPPSEAEGLLHLAGDISHLPLLSVDSRLQFLHAGFAVPDDWVHLGRLDIAEVVLEFSRIKESVALVCPVHVEGDCKRDKRLVAFVGDVIAIVVVLLVLVLEGRADCFVFECNHITLELRLMFRVPAS